MYKYRYWTSRICKIEIFIHINEWNFVTSLRYEGKKENVRINGKQPMFLDRKLQYHKFNMIPVKITKELFVTKQADTEVPVKKFLMKNNQELKK